MYEDANAGLYCSVALVVLLTEFPLWKYADLAI